MDVMVADIAREPGPQRTGFYVTGRLHGGFVVGPARTIIESNTGEIVLSVKQISSDGTGNEVRDQLGQYQRGPAKEISEGHRNHEVHRESNKAIVVCSRIAEGRSDTHPIKKHDGITEQDGQRMTHEQILKALGLGGLQILISRHNRKRSNVRTP